MLAVLLQLLPRRCGALHRASALRASSRAARPLRGSVYEFPELYDAAFSFRDFEAEVDFLLGAHEKHGRSGAAKRVLEVAAGPARHSIEAARRGLAAVALDASPEMAAYGAALAREAGVDVRYVEGDMAARASDPYAGVAPCDAAWLLLGSAGHCLTAEDAVSTLANAARALVPGGTLVLELPHPRETFRVDDVGLDSWVATARDGSDVEVTWGKGDDAFDPLTQIRMATVAFDVYAGSDDGDGDDNARTKVTSLVDTVPTREFSFQEVLLLAQLSGAFDADVATYGALELDIAADDEDLAFRLVVVLTTKGGSS